MYIWRRWRDTVGYFFLCLVFAMLFGGGVPAKHSQRQALATLNISWLLLGIPVGLLIGLVIGGRSIGTEISGGCGEFTMTRPRSRKYFIWTGWAVGVAEMFAILAAATICRAGGIYYEGGPIWRQSRDMSVDIPMLLASAVVFTLFVYGATYFANVVTRRAGVSAAIVAASIAAYEILLNMFGWANAHLPELLLLPDTPVKGGFLRDPAVRVLAIWAICALVFPLLAQFFFEGSEI